jgi:hypothetical protein
VYRWTKTAAGGETTLSGNDNNSVALAYVVGQELLHVNGILLVRGTDYTASTGTTITGLTALAASDVVDIWSPDEFNVSNAVLTTVATAKGDIFAATARLGCSRLPGFYPPTFWRVADAFGEGCVSLSSVRPASRGAWLAGS